MFNKRLRTRMDLLHSKADHMLEKHQNSKTLLLETMVSAQLAIEKAAKAIDRTYIEIGKAAERRQEAEKVSREIEDELGDDD